jgi:hypothetical protein
VNPDRAAVAGREGGREADDPVAARGVDEHRAASVGVYSSQDPCQAIGGREQGEPPRSVRYMATGAPPGRNTKTAEMSPGYLVRMYATARRSGLADRAPKPARWPFGPGILAYSRPFG